MCDKVREKGRTTYTEVANEIVAETVSQTGDFDEKNIRRRVYDALNVLMALNIVHKEKNKERTISWVGLPTSNSSHDKSHVSVQCNLFTCFQHLILVPFGKEFVTTKNSSKGKDFTRFIIAACGLQKTYSKK